MKLADMIKKGEGGQTILFILTGYLLTWLWFIFLSAEIHYSPENGVSWIFTREGVRFGGIAAFFTGLLLPCLCFWFKFYRWKLAWALMFLVFAGGILLVALRENQPERIFRNRFGHLARGVQLEAMTVSPAYENSYEVYKLSGDTEKIQSALRRLFQGEERDLLSELRHLPEFMRPSGLPEKAVGWNYSIYVWTWTDGPYLYIRFNTWKYHALNQWEQMLRETTPEAKK